MCFTENFILGTMSYRNNCSCHYASNGGNDDNTMMAAAKEKPRVPFQQN